VQVIVEGLQQPIVVELQQSEELRQLPPSGTQQKPSDEPTGCLHINVVPPRPRQHGSIGLHMAVGPRLG
jgi:hypothetical protein